MWWKTALPLSGILSPQHQPLPLDDELQQAWMLQSISASLTFASEKLPYQGPDYIDKKYKHRQEI